jgi:hypothetical protein
MEKVAGPTHRREFEVRDWIEDELRRERNGWNDAIASGAKNSVGAGAHSGAVETLERLKRFLDGDEEA